MKMEKTEILKKIYTFISKEEIDIRDADALEFYKFYLTNYFSGQHGHQTFNENTNENKSKELIDVISNLFDVLIQKAEKEGIDKDIDENSIIDYYLKTENKINEEELKFTFISKELAIFLNLNPSQKYLIDNIISRIQNYISSQSLAKGNKIIPDYRLQIILKLEDKEDFDLKDIEKRIRHHFNPKLENNIDNNNITHLPIECREDLFQVLSYLKKSSEYINSICEYLDILSIREFQKERSKNNDNILGLAEYLDFLETFASEITDCLTDKYSLKQSEGEIIEDFISKIFQLE